MVYPVTYRLTAEPAYLPPPLEDAADDLKDQPDDQDRANDDADDNPDSHVLVLHSPTSASTYIVVAAIGFVSSQRALCRQLDARRVPASRRGIAAGVILAHRGRNATTHVGLTVVYRTSARRSATAV